MTHPPRHVTGGVRVATSFAGESALRSLLFARRNMDKNSGPSWVFSWLALCKVCIAYISAVTGIAFTAWDMDCISVLYKIYGGRWGGEGGGGQKPSFEARISVGKVEKCP